MTTMATQGRRGNVSIIIINRDSPYKYYDTVGPVTPRS